jgi:hypothetical protein
MTPLMGHAQNHKIKNEKIISHYVHNHCIQ